MFSIRHTSPLCNRSGSSGFIPKCSRIQRASSSMLFFSSSHAEVSMAVNLISISFLIVVFLFSVQMYASEILVPRTDEIKGNSRKSQANVQAQTACFTPFSLSVYLWLRYDVKCPHDTTGKRYRATVRLLGIFSLITRQLLGVLSPMIILACISLEEKGCRY